jgi:hypothetical protein
LAQNVSSTGIPSAHCWISPLSYHLEKTRCSKEEGSFKEEERFLKEMEVKMTSYIIIKMAVYYYIMATYYNKISTHYYKMNYDSIFQSGPFHPWQQFLISIQGGSSLLQAPLQRKLVI